MQSFHSRLQDGLDRHHPAPTPPTVPTKESLARASALLHRAAGNRGLGTENTISHLLEDVIPGLSGQVGPRYFGFVTGGVHPAAAAADAIVTALDQNVQVHLPDASIATELEAVALDTLAQYLGLKDEQELSGGRGLFSGRTFTTGATASNVLGLACGRESILSQRLPAGSPSVAELGVLEACFKAGVKGIRVLTSCGHSSLSKAASVVGIGRAQVKELPRSKSAPWLLDLEATEAELRAGEEEGVACVVAISLGEVNTGRYALGAPDEMQKLRDLSVRYKSWIHVDGAFGIFAGLLPSTPQFAAVRTCVEGLQTYADSITVDGHKLLNVPYDCGMFFSRSLELQTEVFRNPNAAYLSAGSAAATVPSPLNIGLENSRRFRALPVYAVLRAEGREGLGAMFERMVVLARGIAQFVRESENYELLPDKTADVEQTFMIVLFRAKDPGLNEVLVSKLNETREIWVSGTSWNGKKAVRVAVSNHGVDVSRDLTVVTEILRAVAQDHLQHGPEQRNR